MCPCTPALVLVTRLLRVTCQHLQTLLALIPGLNPLNQLLMVVSSECILGEGDGDKEAPWEVEALYHPSETLGLCKLLLNL